MDGSKLPYPTLLQNIPAGTSPAVGFAGGAGSVEGPRQRKPFSGLCSHISYACDGQLVKEQLRPFPGRAGRAAALAAQGPRWRGMPGKELLVSDLCKAAALTKF